MNTQTLATTIVYNESLTVRFRNIDSKNSVPAAFLGYNRLHIERNRKWQQLAKIKGHML